MPSEQSSQLKLNLGCGKLVYPDFINVDIFRLTGVNIICNLETGLPFADNTFSEILIEHTLEHINNFMGLMEEIFRTGIPGGVVKIYVPYYRYEGAYHDPTHVRFFAERSFEIFKGGFEYDYYTKARFDVIKIELHTTHKTSTSSLAKKIMKLPIPFRRFLNNFLWNIYSEIYYELRINK